MAVTATYCLLIPAIVATLVFTSTVVGQSQCNGGTFNVFEYGYYLNSPNYPGNYSSLMNCQWTLRNFFTNKIVLELVYFNLEGSQPNCSHDYVAIYDGSSTSSPRIQLLCGQVANTHFVITGSYMTVVFHSDGSNNFKGFSFIYSSNQELVQRTDATTETVKYSTTTPSYYQCNNTNYELSATETVKYFTSPGYPYQYPSNMDCQWQITVPPFSSRVIQLTLLNLTLEYSGTCTLDYVAIYDGSSISNHTPSIKLLCGITSNTIVKSTGTSLTVVFHSDGSYNYKGFRFAYTSIDKPVLTTEATSSNFSNYLCKNEILSATETPQYFTSPGYPYNYQNNMDCQWKITVSSYSSRVIKLTLLDFNLEYENYWTCINDYVAIYDGDSRYSPRIQLLCGGVSNQDFKSNGTSMTIVFHSNYAITAKGFKFKYTSIFKPAQFPSTTTSVNYPRKEFLSAYETRQYFTSPGYPNNYPNNVDYEWHITATSTSNVVMLRIIESFVLEVSSTCIYDYVAIFDGDSRYSPRIQLLCGEVSNQDFKSTGQSMTIVFHSDSGTRAKGFKFEYTSIEKPAQFPSTTTSVNYPRKEFLSAYETPQYFTSPGYPNNYPNNVDYEWHITATSTSNVVMLGIIESFVLEVSSTCTYDYVAIFDGDSKFSPRIQLLCGGVSNQDFKSTGQSMTIVFHSDSGTRAKGFKFEYTSIEKPAQFPSTTTSVNYPRKEFLSAYETPQYFTSPGYPNNYPNNVDYEWHITATSTSNVVMLRIIESFVLEVSSTCIYDYVAIFDGDSRYSPRIQLLCGEVSNQDFKSTGQSMTIVFHSDSSTRATGFKFEYTSIEKPVHCSDKYVTATETVKYLTSPGYPYSYPSNTDCEYHISSFSDSRVSLGISQFSLNGFQYDCITDYVKIYDGSSTASDLIKVLCGQVNYGSFVSTQSDMTVVFHSEGGKNYNSGFSFSYQSQKKGGSINTSDYTGTIIAIVASGIAVPFFIVVFVVCARRRIAMRQLRNTQNRTLGPNAGREAAVRGNSLFIVTLLNNQRAHPPPYLGMENSQSTFEPPPYSSLNLNTDESVPAYTPRTPEYNINDLPPPYSHDLPGGIAHREQTTLLNNSRQGKPSDGSTAEGGAFLNRGFNFTNTDDVVGQNHIVGQNASTGVNPTTDTNMVASPVASCPPSYTVPRSNPSCPDINFAPSAPPIN